MNYLKIYNSLSANRQQNPISRNDCYCERHHIIPKSEGGSNETSNLVYLTAREHYICHLLLAKIYNDRKLWSIIHLLMGKNNRTKKDFKYNSKLYEKSKIRDPESRKGRPGYWSGKKRNEEFKQKLSKKFKGRKISEEQRQVLAKIQTGTHLSEATKQKISNAHKGKSLSMEHRQKLSIKFKGRKITPHTEEHKLKISQTLKKKMSLEKRQKIAEQLRKFRGMKWFNNGVNNTKAFECPDGYVPGRLRNWIK